MDLVALFFGSFLAATILPLGSEPALAAIVAAAGAARMRFVPFSLWTIAGNAARYAVLAIIVDRSIR